MNSSERSLSISDQFSRVATTIDGEAAGRQWHFLGHVTVLGSTGLVDAEIDPGIV